MSDIASRRTFARLLTVRKARLMGVSLAALGVLALSLLVGLLTAIAGAPAVGYPIMGVGVVLGLLLLVSRLLGRTLPERLGIRSSHRRRVKVGDHVGVGGVVAGAGAHRPQGLLAELAAVDLQTETGVPFTLVWFESSQTAAVSFEVIPTDKSGLSQSSIDALVDTWAALLVQAAEIHAPGLITVVTESTLTDGSEISVESSMQRERLRTLSLEPTALDPEGSLAAARQEGIAPVVEFVDALSDRISANTPVLSQRVTVSFVPARHRDEDGKEKASLETAIPAAVAAVPDFMAWLLSVGCRSVKPLMMPDLAEATRCAFDPAMTAIFSQARAEGDPIRLSWDEAGPAASAAGVKTFVHEDWVSATMQMNGPPAQAFTERALAGLLKPDPDVAVRRITQFLTPFTAAESAAMSNGGEDRAAVEAGTARKVRAKNTHEMQVAAANAKEIEEKGSVFYRYAMTCTITAADEAALARGKRTLSRDVQTGVKVALRQTYRQTDSSFMLGLGLGLVPSRVATLHDVIREIL